MKKKWGIVIAILVIVLLIVGIIFVTMKDGVWIESGDNQKDSNSGEGQSVIITSGEQTAIKDATIKVGEFIIENLSMEYTDGYTFIKGDIVNNTDKNYMEGASFRISLFENEKVLMTFPVMSSTLIAGGRSSFNTQLTLDCTLATDIVVDLVEAQ
ncbi:MAG: hypothetical protein IKJ32_02515 [Clostridia bacterium]|nr:hypothetical protein [Clostridia bacterium]